MMIVVALARPASMAIPTNPATCRCASGLIPPAARTPLQSTVVWSSFANPLDAFVLQQVEAVAQSDKVTVFVWSSPTYPEKHTGSLCG